MAETLLDVRKLPKGDAYLQVNAAIGDLLRGIDDHVAAMATISSVLHHGFGHLWTGFYRVVEPELLRVGPYQGTVGCLDIKVGKGVCGTSAAERRTVIVRDVNAFEGHIVCDARARSEIVVPVFDVESRLMAVLDIDSEHVGTFDDEDREGLEEIVRWFTQHADQTLLDSAR